MYAAYMSTLGIANLNPLLTPYLGTGCSLNWVKEHEHMALTIGQVAKAAHVNVETLRYYERRGLVPRPPRSLSRYRRYPEDTPPRVRFVKHAQALGFSLQEIRELLSLRATPKARC